MKLFCGLMSALLMRGFRTDCVGLGAIDFWDAVYFLIGLTVFGPAMCDRFGVLSIPVL
ncbi:hypothetical protein AB0758_45560 [Tolypothrix bouteillei VB521301_2]|uniref:hypothetical protein n=1 Tax=Tolypothrix bouteillei TaxID=1246981 RepID=UPI0038B56D07